MCNQIETNMRTLIRTLIEALSLTYSIDFIKRLILVPLLHGSVSNLSYCKFVTQYILFPLSTISFFLSISQFQLIHKILWHISYTNSYNN